ncbi:phosphopantothenoylcysteine decarboxylase domain-containing protein [Jeotgalibacillus terrae]|uniref:Phosphopantothenoylcysteine decarboxylase n=1 Tax=Jeotgalibacillus terrae TaxID=587735 RepID=A0ABW5ZGU9_9BACL|nr:phosphopantothenoylcysteine decarboxylase [Jeotgalibacillus terrae]MBM7578575.1 phosphopantothenoylcysteine synthetase/decarboxylase [Jeotgalibacillus terrae]
MFNKNVLITSGGCLEKWDQVRGHTNLAKGTIGKMIAEEALSQGANVTYLHGYFADKPDAEVTCESFEGIMDLQEKMKKIILNEKIDVVIMAAAGSDWIVDKMIGQDGEVLSQQGKLSSDNPPIIHFKKAPKILKQIKEWDPHVLLVGFKLESDADYITLLDRAKQRMHTSDADLMVANSSESLYSAAAAHYIINHHHDIYKCSGKEDTSEKLMQFIDQKLLQKSCL